MCVGCIGWSLVDRVCIVEVCAMQWCCDLAVDQCCMGEKRASAVPRWQASHGAPLWVCLDASPPTVPLCACALMPALTQCPTAAVCRCQPSHVASPPLCLNASPATVGVHRCQPSHGAPLSLCCDAGPPTVPHCGCKVCV